MNRDPKKQPNYQKPAMELSVSPQEKVCPKFDAQGIAEFPVGNPHKMGFRVVDNCTEEHIQ